MGVLVYAQSRDRKTLADKLVAYSEMPRQEAEDLASIAGPGPYIPLPLMDPSAILKEFLAEAQRTFSYQALIMEEDIMSGYPLAIDEELLEDGLLTRCLAEAAIVYPRGTIAVRRIHRLGVRPSILRFSIDKPCTTISTKLGNRRIEGLTPVLTTTGLDHQEKVRNIYSQLAARAKAR